MPTTFIILYHCRPKCIISQDGKCRQSVVENRGLKVCSMAPTSGRPISGHVDLSVAGVQAPSPLVYLMDRGNGGGRGSALSKATTQLEAELGCWQLFCFMQNSYILYNRLIVLLCHNLFFNTSLFLDGVTILKSANLLHI